MRLLCVRLSVRRMIVIITLFAVALGGGIELEKLRRRAQLFQQRASDFREAEKMYLYCFGQNPHPANRFLIESAEYSAGLKRKYDRAARTPWLPVEPDQPYDEWLEAMGYGRRYSSDSLELWQASTSTSRDLSRSDGRRHRRHDGEFVTPPSSVPRRIP